MSDRRNLRCIPLFALSVSGLLIVSVACSSSRDAGSRDSTSAVALRDSAGKSSASMSDSSSTARPGAGATAGAESLRPVQNDTILGNFVATVDRGEIEAGKLALSKSRSASVKAYARMMIDAHTKDLALTARLLHNNGIATMDSSAMPAAVATADDLVSQTKAHHQDAMTQLRDATGEAFDRAYMDAMIAGHQDVLNSLQKNAGSATLAPLASHLASVEKVVTEHLSRAKEVQQKLPSAAMQPRD